MLSKLGESDGEEEGHHAEDTPLRPSEDVFPQPSQDLSHEEGEMVRDELYWASAVSCIGAPRAVCIVI